MKTTTATLTVLLRHAARELVTSSETPRLDAELLLAHVLGRPRSYLYTWPEAQPNTAEMTLFQSLLARRVRGEPIAYLTGRREFWSLDLEVSPATLIPRPETELLVELALEKLPLEPCYIADLGTGSGAIALALARERPNWRILACDASAEALGIARSNAERLDIDSIEFQHSDWLTSIPPLQFNMIVSNPPYVAAASPYLQQGDVRFEPSSALIAGQDGLDAIRQIIKQSGEYLASGAYLLFEHGNEQGAATRKLLQQARYHEIETKHDLAGHERVSGGRWYGA